MKNLILIGYWHSEYEPDWPAPARFVDPAWKPEIRDAVIKYLDSGVTLHTAMGMSWCRFRCRQFGRFGLGASELTDGVYLWPDGLSHYLKAHAVRLPDKFVQFVPYWRISTAEFLAEVRMGAEYTSKKRMDHWRFQELSAKASEVGLALKFILERDKS